jgi:hypothetical protein
VTESDWDSCTDLQAMLSFLRDSGRASDRKLRLFAVACCRRVWRLLPDPCGRAAVEASERDADGLADAGQLSQAYAGAQAALRETEEAALRADTRAEAYRAGARALALTAALRAARHTKAGEAAAGAVSAVLVAEVPSPLQDLNRPYDPRDIEWLVEEAQSPAAAVAEGQLRGREQVAQCELLRCVVGNPFRPISLDPAWLAWHGGAILKLAQAIYDDRLLPSGHLDAARLAVLADMLEEAGCCDEQLLTHLRGPGPHVRGCFAVDAVLGRV